jgi:hypothetical protein
MDIERLRKIQETEKALRIHSINLSPREAIDAVKSDVYVGGTRVPTFDELKQSPGDILLRQKEEAYARSKQKEVSQMEQNDLKRQLNEQGELIAKQAQLIYELQGTINDIIREVKKMQTSVPTKNPAERQQIMKPEERTQHPRSGGYTPGSSEVSVEKFFYAGSK